MEGAAVGLLSKLPKHARDVYYLPRFKDKQNWVVLLKTPVLRDTLDEIWRTSTQSNVDTFIIDIGKKAHKKI